MTNGIVQKVHDVFDDLAREVKALLDRFEPDAHRRVDELTANAKAKAKALVDQGVKDVEDTANEVREDVEQTLETVDPAHNGDAVEPAPPADGPGLASDAPASETPTFDALQSEKVAPTA